MKTGAQTSRTDRNKFKRYTDSESNSYNNMSLSTYHIKKKLMSEKRKVSNLGECSLSKQKFIISLNRMYFSQYYYLYYDVMLVSKFNN